MDGNRVFEENRVSAAHKIFEKNPDKPYLEGFFNSMMDGSITTALAYLRYVVVFVDYCGKPVKEIKYDDYINYLASLRTKTSSYRIAVYSGLKKFSYYLQASGLNEDYAMERIKRPKPFETEETIEKRKKNYLTKAEIKKLLQTIDTGIGTHHAVSVQAKWKKRDRALILVMLTTGIRKGAVYKLDVNSVNFEKAVITATDKGHLVVDHPIPQNTLDALKEWIEDRKIKLHEIEVTDKNALFISRKGNRLSEQSICEIVERFSQRIIGKKISPHKLRATFATQLYNQTKDIVLVQEMMSHSSPTITKMYIRGGDEKKRKAADIMGKIISNIEE
ncbi:Site-specific recombinase XerD [Lachnospiraceae bacterium KHCPX20]|nr:Site-specific recombinase XerD [Lachnospiraceae bacterium KHCPX20]